MSYYKDRLDSLFLTTEDCTDVLTYDVAEDDSRKGRFQYIRPSDEGIDIYFFDLHKNVRYFDVVEPENVRPGKDRQNHKEYKITRLDNPVGDMKYKFPAGVGETYPFIPTEICDKYAKGEKIKVLYLTEGAFKAWKAAKHGLNIVGLTSITHYKQADGVIYRDISRIIEKCNVECVCMLYDNDCLDLGAKDLTTNGDLARRPTTFFNSMVSIYNLLLEYPVDIYFTHILKDVEGSPKGLDDLYCSFHGNEDIITRDLNALSRCNDFTYKLNLKTNFKRLRSYFGIKNAQAFFAKHESEIMNTGNNSFIFYGSQYRININADTGEKEITLEVPADLNKFFRCGDDYYELVPTPNPWGEMEDVLTKRSAKTITDDFGKDALKYVQKYKAFVNIPSNVSYQRIINNCYNIYNEIHHEIKEGSWRWTETFLQHIFGEYYELGLDYLTILYREPTQKLPVLCLVSEERRTGKTTFLDWLCDIYGENGCIIGNEELKSQFNGVFLQKLIVGLDETSLADNREITERIKMLSTAKKIPTQRKGVDFTINYIFAKFILCSNKVDSFIYTEGEENRFFVLKIPTLDGKEIVDLRNKLHEEIPAFLFYIQNRKITHKKESRMWFAYDLYRTQAFEALCEKQKPRAQKIVESFIAETMEDFNLKELLVTKDAICEMVPDLRKFELQVNDILKRLSNDKATKPQRFSIPYWVDNEGAEAFGGDPMKVSYRRFLGRPYLFTKH